MHFSPAFRFKHKPVYALPTLLGLGLLLMIIACICMSISFRAPLEQWLSFLMILCTLLHLVDSSDPFRSLQLDVQSFDPPFANRTQKISLIVRNPTDAPSEALFFRLEGDEEWHSVGELAARATRKLVLHWRPTQKGIQMLPRIRMKTFPRSHFFQLWRVFDSEGQLMVLPEPIHHGAPWVGANSKQGESDVSSLDPIRDPRLLHLRDEKLFQKTGRDFLRTRDAGDAREERNLVWNELRALTYRERDEQFSFWLEKLDLDHSERRLFLTIETPFFRSEGAFSPGQHSKLKLKFADFVRFHD